jgi:hypothetical protein
MLRRILEHDTRSFMVPSSPDLRLQVHGCTRLQLPQISESIAEYPKPSFQKSKDGDVAVLGFEGLEALENTVLLTR